MKLTVVLSVLIGSLVLACSSAAPAPAEPTPNIDATVEAKLAQERAVDATVEARAKELVAEQPTATPYPTYTPVPTATPLPKSTDTPVPQPTSTPKPAPTNTPTSVPTATSVPTPTPRPIPTATPVPTPTPTPMPPTKFEGGFVMLIGGDSFGIKGEIAFKVGSQPAEQTVTVGRSDEYDVGNMWGGGFGNMLLVDLYATSSNSNLPLTFATYPESVLVPHVIAGRAYIDGKYAPDGTVVSAWVEGEEIVDARTTVINQPVALVPTELKVRLDSKIVPPSLLPTPCPVYQPCGEQQYYSGTLSENIEVIWHKIAQNIQSEDNKGEWVFYSPDPAWQLANTIPTDFCNYIHPPAIYETIYDPAGIFRKPFFKSDSDGICHVGTYVRANKTIIANSSQSEQHQLKFNFSKYIEGDAAYDWLDISLVPGWNLNILDFGYGYFSWPAKD